MHVDCQSIRLKWNKPQDVLSPLFELDIKEKGENWKVVYRWANYPLDILNKHSLIWIFILFFLRGFHNCFCIKNLSGGHTYKFKLSMVASDDILTDRMAVNMATLSCTTKSNYCYNNYKQQLISNKKVPNLPTYYTIYTYSLSVLKILYNWCYINSMIIHYSTVSQKINY